MAQHQTSNDLPVIVGAVVVGLIAIGIFYFTRAEPIPAPTPEQPVRGEPAATAAAPVMTNTKVEPFDIQQGGMSGGGAMGGGVMGGSAPTMGGAAGGGQGQPAGPMRAGVSGAG